MEKIRLQKFFADSGIMSRRKCESAISAGRIKINGETASLGERVDPEKDEVCLDDSPLSYAGCSRRTYIMLNKPMGYVTTMSDEKGRKSVADLVSDCPARVYPVGRLDMYSEGLLLMTDDGDTANRLMHPSTETKKVYRLTVKGKYGDELCALLSSVTLLDGKTLMPVECVFAGSGEMTKDGRPTSCVDVTLREGRNRQIRRMCAEVGLKVVRLKRTCEAGLSLGTLAPGKWRRLTDSEISLIKGEVR